LVLNIINIPDKKLKIKRIGDKILSNHLPGKNTAPNRIVVKLKKNNSKRYEYILSTIIPLSH
jgi:hypothetical protein